METKTYLNEADIHRLEELYTFIAPQKVIAFLEDAAFLVPILFEAHPRIRRYFPEADLFLTVLADPTGIDQPILEIEVSAESHMADRLERREAFGDAWWLDAMSRTRHRLNIHI